MDNPLGHASNQKVTQDGMPVSGHYYHVGFSCESDDDLMGYAEMHFGSAVRIALLDSCRHAGQFFRGVLL